MKNQILLCSFLFLAIPLASSQEGYRVQSNNKEKLSYVYFDINDTWKTGYSDAFVTSNSNKVPNEKVTVYAVDSSPQELLSGNSFMFTDLAGNQTMLSFTENSLIEFANEYKTEIPLTYTSSGYRYSDPLLKAIIPEEFTNNRGVSKNRSIPSVTRDVALYTDGNLLYLATVRHHGYTKKASEGILGKMSLTKNEAMAQTIQDRKVAFLHTVQPLWPNIPYRFYEKTEPRNSPFKQTIQALVNGNSEDVKDSFFETFHNIFLWKLGSYFKDAIKNEQYTELHYTYKNTASTQIRLGKFTEKNSSEVNVLIPTQFERTFWKFLKEKHFNNSEGTRPNNVFDVFFASLQGYDDPRLQNLLLNLERYTKNEPLGRWLGAINKIRSDYKKPGPITSKTDQGDVKSYNGNDNPSFLSMINTFYRDKRYEVKGAGNTLLVNYKVDVVNIHWIPDDPKTIAASSMGQYEIKISKPLYVSIPSTVLYTKGMNPESSKVRQVVRDLIAGEVSKTNATISILEDNLHEGKFEVVDITWYWTF
ncbi:hypothetical protein [Altibacter sp. HG106]|uniref:hypothetical protein n=1 Tax=Altibacter sp. HG106 TaxID=3023937 RepID=UPI0023506F74|nr:hypothetical protein [Altibacter sp. HG106]MDC7995082.1 hypothetical protein [Altibacter sp. HG106]